MAGYFSVQIKEVSKKASKYRSVSNNALAASAYITATKQISALAAASYITGSSISNCEDEEIFDYSHKRGVLYSDLLLPADAPERLLNPSQLWGEVMMLEARRKDAVLYREFICCFEKHLSLEQMISVAESFARRLTEEGMAVQFAIHDQKKENGNFHCHFLTPVRGFKNGEWNTRIVKPQEYILDSTGNRIPCLNKDGIQLRNKDGSLRWKKSRVEYEDSFNDRRCNNKQRWRRMWADLQNEYLPEEFQVSSDSYLKQGRDLIPRKRLSKSEYIYHQKLLKSLDKYPVDKILKDAMTVSSAIQEEYSRVFFGKKGDSDVYLKMKSDILAHYFSSDFCVAYEPLFIKHFSEMELLRIEHAFAGLLDFHIKSANYTNQVQILEEQMYLYERIFETAKELLLCFSGLYSQGMIVKLEQLQLIQKQQQLKSLQNAIHEIDALLQMQPALAEVNHRLNNNSNLARILECKEFISKHNDISQLRKPEKPQVEAIPKNTISLSIIKPRRL